MNLNDISPEEFIKTIVYTTHKNYESSRKYVKKWRIMKLVIKIAEDLDYEGFSSGLYKHGHYSFFVNNVFDDFEFKSSLHGVKIKKTEINKSLQDITSPLINKYQSLFIGKTPEFSDWAHNKRVPDEYIDFYKYGDPLLKIIEDLPKYNKEDISTSYDDVSSLITSFDNCLDHVESSKISHYFDYIDLFETLLLVCRNHNFNSSLVKPLLKKMEYTYYSGIYSYLPPFKQTLESKDNIDIEKKAYEMAILQADTVVNRNLPKIQKEIIENDLEPSLEDLDEEIKKEFAKSDESKRNEFIKFMCQRVS